MMLYTVVLSGKFVPKQSSHYIVSERPEKLIYLSDTIHVAMKVFLRLYFYRNTFCIISLNVFIFCAAAVPGLRPVKWRTKI